MYEKDGIIYVEGMEDEFMQWHLIYMKDRYKHVLRKEDPTPEMTARIKEVELQFKMRRLAKANPYEEMFNPQPQVEEPKEKPKPKEVVVTASAEEWGAQKQKKYAQKYYEVHREQILAKKRKPGSTYRHLNIPAPAGTKEYQRLYWELKGAEISEKRKQRYREEREEDFSTKGCRRRAGSGKGK